MKKLTPKQMNVIVDFLSDCYLDYKDDYSVRAINTTLKALNYVNQFRYDYENDAVICNGGIDQQEMTEYEDEM